MNDIYKSANVLSFILYAEDTNIFERDSNLKSLMDTVNPGLIYIFVNGSNLINYL